MALKFASVSDLMRMVIAVDLSALRLVTIVIFLDTKINSVPDYRLSPIKTPYFECSVHQCTNAVNVVTWMGWC